MRKPTPKEKAIAAKHRALYQQRRAIEREIRDHERKVDRHNRSIASLDRKLEGIYAREDKLVNQLLDLNQDVFRKEARHG